MKMMLLIPLLFLPVSAVNATTVLPENSYQIDETSSTIIGTGSNSDTNFLYFDLTVGEGLAPINAFAVGFVNAGTSTSPYKSAITSVDGWTAQWGTASQWGTTVSDSFGDTSWNDFLAYDPETAGIIDAFVFFSTENNADAISFSTPQDGDFLLTWHSGFKAPGWSPTAISTVNGGSFGGPANEVVSASVSAVPVPAATYLFAPALLGFLGLRRKMRA